MASVRSSFRSRRQILSSAVLIGWSAASPQGISVHGSCPPARDTIRGHVAEAPTQRDFRFGGCHVVAASGGNHVIYSLSLWSDGAGEGIRTPDPNLGNVPRRFTPQHLFPSGDPLNTYHIGIFLARLHPKPILLLPSDFRSGASPLLPRPPPENPGKQISEQAWNTRAGVGHG